ncbi:unnamed protein product, partial [Clonostachys chloroleuca]
MQCLDLEMPTYCVATQPQLRKDLVKLLLDREEPNDRTPDEWWCEKPRGRTRLLFFNHPALFWCLVDHSTNHAFSNQHL